MFEIRGLFHFVVNPGVVVRGGIKAKGVCKWLRNSSSYGTKFFMFGLLVYYYDR